MNITVTKTVINRTATVHLDIGTKLTVKEGTFFLVLIRKASIQFLGCKGSMQYVFMLLNRIIHYSCKLNNIANLKIKYDTRDKLKSMKLSV